MKTTLDFSICLLTSLLILGLRQTKSERQLTDHCKEDKDCDSNHCCSAGTVSYCKDTCEAPITKTQRGQKISGEEVCGDAKKKYRFYKEIVNWYTALRACCLQGSGARLMDIETPADEKFLRTLPGKYSQGVIGLWTGANAISSAQRDAINLTWAGTNKPVNLPNEGFDNYYAGEHCIHLRNTGSSTFNDHSCFEQHFYMCYYPNEKCA